MLRLACTLLVRLAAAEAQSLKNGRKAGSWKSNGHAHPTALHRHLGCLLLLAACTCAWCLPCLVAALPCLQMRRFNLGPVGEADCPVFDGMMEYFQASRCRRFQLLLLCLLLL